MFFETSAYIELVGSVLVLAAAITLLWQEVARSHGFGRRIAVHWISIGIAMDVFLWALLPFLGKRPLPFLIMVIMGSLIGTIVGLLWQVGWAPHRRRVWEAENRYPSPAPGTVTLPGGSMTQASDAELDEIRGGAARLGAYFICLGIFIYAVLARALTGVPEAAYPAIPAMLLGGLVGFVVAWRFPFSPTRSVAINDASLRDVRRYPPTQRERLGREILFRIRSLKVFVAVSAPYFVVLLVLFVKRLSTSPGIPYSGNVAWLIILGGLGLVGTLPLGWGIQIIEVWFALGRTGNRRHI